MRVLGLVIDRELAVDHALASAAHPRARKILNMHERENIGPDEILPFVSFRQAVKMLRSSHNRLRKARESGQIHAILINRRWVIPRAEILRLLSGQGGE